MNGWKLFGVIVAGVVGGFFVIIVGLVFVSAMTRPAYIPPVIDCTPQPPICGSVCYTPEC